MGTKKIRYYINTHKHPLVDVELTGAVKIDADLWDLWDDDTRREYIKKHFFNTVQWSFEEED